MSTSAVTVAPTSNINWRRVLGCGVLADAVCIILGTIATAVLARDFIALPHNRLAAPTHGFITLNIILDLLTGVSILWMYAAIRPRYGPGPKTPVLAAFATWFIVSLEDAIWCSFEPVSSSHRNPAVRGDTGLPADLPKRSGFPPCCAESSIVVACRHFGPHRPPT